MTDSDLIKSWAREIGFDKVGITPAGPAPGGEHLTTWLKRRYHAKMKWMTNNVPRRLDPRNVLPGAQSIICLAVNYYTPHERDVDESKISRYAWGTDYHHTLGEMLKQLIARIADECPGSNNLWYVDTGPVLEKAWAQQAGLGWIGKNDILISRDFGTWLFLGEVITSVQLPADLPEQDHCGTCTYCIEACPTGAIVEPYVVDSGRCISYWTIEHRGEFPPGIADKLDGWVFGCDICQDVCPFNRFQKNTEREKDFAPRMSLLQADGWQKIGEEEFSERTAKSPLRRAKLQGIQRNLRAAGKSKSRK
jgi:epoxyqueuosine reductase